MSAAAAIAKQDEEDVEEKCTICLCNFEEEEDVRYVVMLPMGLATQER